MSTVRVDCYAGYRGEETPRRLHSGDQHVDLVEVLDRWISPEYRHFKCRGDDEAVYMLRHDVSTNCRELTLYDRVFGMQADQSELVVDEAHAHDEIEEPPGSCQPPGPAPRGTGRADEHPDTGR